jgi:uncharacterized protein
MTELLTRATFADLEVRSDGRTIVGLAAPFDTPTTINDRSGAFTEVIRPGAFTRTIRERGDRVKLLRNHDSAQLVGRATTLIEDARGLRATFRVSSTAAGDEALALARDGALDALSIGFNIPQGGERITRTGVRELIEIRLSEVSLVTFAAYDSARIEAVRNGHSFDQELEQLQLRARRLALL